MQYIKATVLSIVISFLFFYSAKSQIIVSHSLITGTDTVPSSFKKMESSWHHMQPNQPSKFAKHVAMALPPLTKKETLQTTAFVLSATGKNPLPQPTAVAKSNALYVAE